MTVYKGFYSYVGADDRAEKGRIVDLAHDLTAQYELLTGETIQLFLDKDALEWGDEWRTKVDANLVTVAFFIPVLTPRYFQSKECRRELQSFAQEAKALGIRELVMPLLYVPVPDLTDETQPDQLKRLAASFQWVDWSELRYSDRDSSAYRRSVAGLAERLARASTVIEALAPAQGAEAEEPTGEEPPGLVDRMAEAEEAMPQWAETIQAIGREIAAIGDVMTEGTAELSRAERQGKGFAGRVTVARRLAGRLDEPSRRILDFGSTFVAQLHSVDSGIRVMIERAAQEVAERPEARTQVCEFFSAIRQLAQSTQEGLGGIEGMLTSMALLGEMSRDLRKPLRTLQQGLTSMMEAREVGDDWLELVAASPVVCGSEEPAEPGPS